MCLILQRRSGLFHESESVSILQQIQRSEFAHFNCVVCVADSLASDNRINQSS